MASHCLRILIMVFSLPSINAQTSSCNEGFSLTKMRKGEVHVWQVGSPVEDIEPKMHSTSLQNPDSGVTTDLKLWKYRNSLHHRHHLKNVHWLLNILGWGMLLPIGVIIARYLRKFPMECNQWYSVHILCQILGFLLGTIGWGIGIYLGNASKQYSFRTHRILSTIIFTFAMIQMFAICLQPKEGDKYRKHWEIYHHLLGYALIALIVANIFQGISNRSSAEKLNWFYVGVLGVLATIALALELCRWIKCKIQKPMVMNSNIYASS